MKISPDTKDSVLFLGGVIGMLTFGLVMPILGYGFNVTLFGAWSAVAAGGVVAGMDTKRKHRNGEAK